MLRGFSKWFAYLTLTAIAILVILSLTNQMGVVRELKEHIAIAKKAGIPDISILEVIRLHRRFTGLLIVSFFGFILLCAGLLTIMQHSREAYLFSEVQDKVRHSLKKTSPGIMMLVLGALALAISNYGYSYLERRYSGVFSAIQQDRASSVRQKGNRDSVVVRRIVRPVDSATAHNNALVKAEDTANTINNTSERFSKSTVATTRTADKNATAGKEIPAQTKTKADSKKETVTGKSIAKSKSASETAKSLSANDSGKETVSTKQLPEPALIKTNMDPVVWARSLQRRTVLFGYVPTRQDKAGYSEVIRIHSGETTLNGDMRWAYGLVTRIMDGYQPAAEEMRRYERIVNQSLAKR